MSVFFTPALQARLKGLLPKQNRDSVGKAYLDELDALGKAFNGKQEAEIAAHMTAFFGKIAETAEKQGLDNGTIGKISELLESAVKADRNRIEKAKEKAAVEQKSMEEDAKIKAKAEQDLKERTDMALQAELQREVTAMQECLKNGEMDGARAIAIRQLRSRACIDFLTKLCVNDQLAREQKLEEVQKNLGKAFSGISDARIGQASYSEWGQFGVQFVELFLAFVQTKLIEAGYDIPVESSSESEQLHTRQMPMNGKMVSING